MSDQSAERTHIALTNEERLAVSAVVHQNYYMPDVFSTVERIIEGRLASGHWPIPFGSRLVCRVCTQQDWPCAAVFRNSATAAEQRAASERGMTVGELRDRDDYWQRTDRVLPPGKTQPE